jgi:hypothetical protein
MQLHKDSARIEYFFVGVGKCGTSWIYEFCKRHGVVSVPAIKEPYLIDQDDAKRQEMESSLWPLPHARADFSNLYYWDTANPRKTHDYNPDAKIIITVRRPSDRIISHYGHLTRNGQLPDRPLVEYLDAGADPFEIMKRSDYSPIIDRYVRQFGEGRVLLLPLELLSNNPRAYADRLCAFVGSPFVPLDDNDRAAVMKRAKARFQPLSSLAKSAAVLMRSAGLLTLLGKFKSSSLIRKILFQDVAPDTNISFGSKTEEIRLLDEKYEIITAEFSGDDR